MGRFAGVAFLSACVLAGCSMLSNIETPQNPTFWWEENSTSINFVDGPMTASVGQPTTLTARVIIGSSSCDRFKSLSATVDATSRSVVLKGTRESKRSNQSLACTGDYGAKLATVSVNFPSAGTYRVVADSYEPASFAPDEDPRASIDILVVAP